MKRYMFIVMAAALMGYVPVSAEPPQAQGSPATPSASKPGSAPAKSGGSPTALKPQTLPFIVYMDQGARENHYIPSGWMGDYGDLKVNPGCVQGPHGGKSCTQITYSAKMANGAGWAGMFWQHPANNWGDKQGGFNLTGAKRITFWARGAKGGEKIAEFKVGGITGEYPDTDSASSGPVELTNQWKQYSVDLNGKDLSNIIGGFAWAASKDDNPDGFTIYLDDIAYE
jgi:hypothetical protein